MKRDRLETLDRLKNVADDRFLALHEPLDMFLGRQVRADGPGSFGEGVDDPPGGVDAGNPFNLIGLRHVKKTHQLPALAVEMDDLIHLGKVGHKLAVMIEEALNSPGRRFGKNQLLVIELIDCPVLHFQVGGAQKPSTHRERDQGNKEDLEELHGAFSAMITPPASSQVSSGMGFFVAVHHLKSKVSFMHPENRGRADRWKGIRGV